MQANPDVSLVVPVLNEAPIIPELIMRSLAALSNISTNVEMILVNDGSTDDTLQAIQKIARTDDRVKYVSLSRNFGHQEAISAGLDRATGKAIVIMDGDLQDPPEVIPALHAEHLRGADVVYAKRRVRLAEVFWKKWAAALFYRVLKYMTRVPI